MDKIEEPQELEVVTHGALEAINRAEIDVQISTAKKYPRSLERFNKTAGDIISFDKETADSCIYSRPVGQEGGKMKFAEGLSVRMAEIVGASYGNLRVGAMIIEQTDRQVRCRGYAHDLESNFAATSEVVEATVTKYGKPYSERMRVVVAKAALSKALRDATFKVVPRALCKTLENIARKVAIGDEKTLKDRVARVMKWVDSLEIDKQRVWDAIGVEGEADIGVKQLELLTGLKTAINDKDTTVDEAFPKRELEKPKKPVIPEGGEGKEKTVEKIEPKAKAKEEEKFDLKQVMFEHELEEEKVLKFLKAKGHLKEDQTIDDLPEKTLKKISEDPAKWVNMVKNS